MAEDREEGRVGTAIGGKGESEEIDAKGAGG